MEPEIVLSTEWATVRYDQTHECVYHTFHKGIGGAPFRETLETGLDVLNTHHLTKWVSDDRLNTAFTPDDIRYACEDWGPRCAACGWKYWALIVPEEIAARGTMVPIVETFYNLGVRVQVFIELDSAFSWISQC
jgi:hypothetical protein